MKRIRRMEQVAQDAERAELELVIALPEQDMGQVDRFYETVMCCKVAADRAVEYLHQQMLVRIVTRSRPRTDVIRSSVLAARVGAVVGRLRGVAERLTDDLPYSGARIDRYDQDHVLVRRGLADVQARRDLHDYRAAGPDWGCISAGSRQLALALLADRTDDETALVSHGAFHAEIVSTLTPCWSMRGQDVDEWLQRRKTRAA